ncbi:MAG: hypothetical protein ACYSWU_24710 [Planctomycetota bacterium]|jgi:hypothetical protein
MAAYKRVSTPAASGGGAFPALEFDWSNGQVLSYTDSAVSSAAISAPAVALSATTDCYITVDAGSPSSVGAVAGSFLLPGNTVLNLAINDGEIISAVRETADGVLTIMPAATPL